MRLKKHPKQNVIYGFASLAMLGLSLQLIRLLGFLTKKELGPLVLTSLPFITLYCHKRYQASLKTIPHPTLTPSILTESRALPLQGKNTLPLKSTQANPKKTSGIKKGSRI